MHVVTDICETPSDCSVSINGSRVSLPKGVANF